MSVAITNYNDRIILNPNKELVYLEIESLHQFLNKLGIVKYREGEKLLIGERLKIMVGKQTEFTKIK